MLEATDELAERFAGRVPQATFDAVRRHLEAGREPARRRLMESGLTGQVAEELGGPRPDRRLAAAPRGLEGARARSAPQLRARPGGTRAGPEPPDGREPARLAQAHQGPLVPPAPAAGPSPRASSAAPPRRPTSCPSSSATTTTWPCCTIRSSTAPAELKVDLDAVLALIDHRREQLQAEAIVLGQRLYAERPKAFVARMRRYWKASRPRRHRNPHAKCGLKRRRPGYPGIGAASRRPWGPAPRPDTPVSSIGRRVEPARLLPEAEREVGPDRRVAAVGVEVPARAPAGVPHRPVQTRLQVGVVGVVGVASHLDLGGAASLHRLQRVQQVVDLGLDHEHHRVVAEPRVRPDDPEHVGEAGHRRAPVGRRAAVPR